MTEGTGPSRRGAMGMLAAAPLVGAAGAGSAAPQPGAAVPRPPATAELTKPELTLVSRHLQWAEPEQGIEIAKAAGFRAIAWTVRPGAHIEAANVERDLPRIV